MTAKSGPLMKEWTPPEVIDIKNIDNNIDMFVIHNPDDNETPYHAFMKNENEKFIEHLTASNFKGPYKFVQDKNFAGWGAMEGPAITRHPDGKQWIM